ncbi:MAG: hypothetical protein WBE92_12735 [Steroidobacteraceae bacterium]
MKKSRWLVCPVLAALLGVPLAGLTQTPLPAAGAAASTSSAPPQFQPSMGDLMTMIVQPRHIKLGLAGRQHNWVYARYELSELRNAFGRVARTIPKYRTMDTAQMVDAMTRGPFAALDSAITSRNAARFASAYEQLTQSCNACHLSEQHAMVVIKVPAAAMFPDQEFKPGP